MTEFRIEKDSMGEVRVPADRIYAAQTQRAVENFPISGLRVPREFIKALGLIKQAAAEVNMDLGLLDDVRGKAIVQAAGAVADGKWDDHFPIDIYQTGSGTSTNMNANEVIAHLSNEILGADAGVKVHPNDHVNMGQSSNDVIPTAIHVSAAMEVSGTLLPALRYAHAALAVRAEELKDVVKTGRTHLMDAMPIRMDQVISGWMAQINNGISRLESTLPRVLRLAIGGTAVGTGINTHPEFGGRVAANLAAKTGLAFTEADCYFASQSTMDSATELSGQLRTTATGLMKFANDLRWMNSGPIAGIGEIALPAIQPGSSIMPGKVNPVVCEAMMMVCCQVIGNDAAVAVGNANGNFELNVMLPMIAHNLLQSIKIMAGALYVITDRGVKGFTVNREAIAAKVDMNPIMVTTLNPVIGYDKAAKIAKQAYKDGRRVKDVAADMTDLSASELDKLLDPAIMTQGGILND